MSAPPKTSDEYSRGTRGSGQGSRADEGDFSWTSRRVYGPTLGRIGVVCFAGALLGAVLLIAAEFTTLYTERIGNATTTVGTGTHDSYALLPIAALVVILALAVLRAASRPALLAIGIAGGVALLIALLDDLPDAHSNSAFREPSGKLVSAGTSAGAGMYLETAGAVLLIGVCGIGFLMLGPPRGGRGGP